MNITWKELKQIMNTENINLIDIRDPYKYQSGSLTAAKNIPMNTLITNPNNFLNKNEIYYIFCDYGSSSAFTSEYLKRKGYNIVNIIGGYKAYQDSV